MTRVPCNTPRLAAAVATLLVLCACTTTSPGEAALEAGSSSIVEGKVVRVDTAPWAYDGNAIVTLSTTMGPVAVHLPARWNLCKAPPPDVVQTLKEGDRVLVTGTATGPADIVVCAEPGHAISRLD